jgi:RsiW-degrading membrane proteinase PrsW (M82 family)
MSTQQRTRLALLPLLPIALIALGWLGFVAIQQASAHGAGPTWLMVVVVAFLVGMPLLVLGLAVAGALQRHDLVRAFIPNSGENIPGTGQ